MNIGNGGRRTNGVAKKVAKGLLFGKLGAILAALGLLLVVIVTVIVLITGATASGGGAVASCDPNNESVNEDGSTVSTSAGGTNSAFSSVEAFVKEHQDAYIEAWGAGGFLPSASITQTMAETSFSMSVPSFASAHNMGGVKWTSTADYQKTIGLYGDGSVSGNGAGTTVGDNTGGGYTWFSSFDAGIVGKAEFMSNQSLYTGAINNTDGISTLTAIANGGWATDPSYLSKLTSLYNSLGQNYKWLDEKAIEKYGTSPVDKSNKSSSKGNKSDSDDDSDEGSSKVNIDGAISWFEERKGKVHYSMQARTGPDSYDCSSSIYYALTSNGADKAAGDYAVSTETEHDWLLANGYQKVYEGNWSSDGEMKDLQRGDIFIWGERGASSGANGHTGMFMSSKEIIHCSYGNDGIATNIYDSYKHAVGDHGTVYIHRATGSNYSDNENACDDDDDDSGSGDAADGTGSVPGDATAWGYKPEDLPNSLKQYIIDPAANGLTYAGNQGWVEHSGQCVDLTESLGNQIWGFSGIVQGAGFQQAAAWAVERFHNNVKNTPKRGAIFSTNQANNHTGIVCHVFEDGSILVVEQNTPLSGIYYFHKPNTWNFRVVSPDTQKEQGFVYAYPNDKEPTIK